MRRKDPQERRVHVALRSLIATQPFFGSLALRMPLTRDAEVQTLRADGETIRWNPEWIEDASMDDVRQAIARVVTACALKHHLRRGDRDYKLWQKASQEVTLPILRNAGITDEDGGVDDKSCERLYEMYAEMSQNQPDGEGPPDPDGKGEVGDWPGKSKGDQNSEGSEGEGDGGGDSADHDNPGEGDPDEQGDGGSDSDSGGGGGQDEESKPEEQPGSGPTEQERRDAEQEWDIAAQEALQIGRKAGTAPGRMTEILESAHASKADWRTILKRHMVAFAKQDYTWSRPNLRHVDSGLYLPAMHSEVLPPIVFAIDTSGSMSPQALAACWSEIREVAEELQPSNVTVIQCDTRVVSIETYDPTNLPEQITAKGRGGTSFHPVFAEIKNMHPAPTLLIYLTDMGVYGEFPDEPSCEVIWAVTMEYEGMSYETPNYGECVEIDLTELEHEWQ